MDIIEQMVAGHRDIREREDFLQKLALMDDDGPAFWNDVSNVSHFFNIEVRRHIELEEKVLFPVLRSLLPAFQGEMIDVFVKEHRPLLEAIVKFDTAAQGHLGNPSSCSRQEVLRLASSVIELVLPHASSEDEILFKLVRTHFRTEDYRHLETLYYRFIGA
jgi:hemerythrin-like domain-containing protein